jgi:hypothetical protein
MSGLEAPTCLKKNIQVWTFRKKVIKKVRSFCYEPYYPHISTSWGVINPIEKEFFYSHSMERMLSTGNKIPGRYTESAI